MRDGRGLGVVLLISIVGRKVRFDFFGDASFSLVSYKLLARFDFGLVLAQSSAQTQQSRPSDCARLAGDWNFTVVKQAQPHGLVKKSTVPKRHAS